MIYPDYVHKEFVGYEDHWRNIMANEYGRGYYSDSFSDDEVLKYISKHFDGKNIT
jgi:hypothetical protein